MTNKTITIFEGPDGGGKSTIAQETAARTNARYVHHEAYPKVGHHGGLARIFYESMLPALYGYQDVVLDRCWISEPIYSAVFRNGENRVSPYYHNLLEQAARRCQPIVVCCLPSLSTCIETFKRRCADEYLDTPEQLAAVYTMYEQVWSYTDLWIITYNWMNPRTDIDLMEELRRARRSGPDVIINKTLEETSREILQ